MLLSPVLELAGADVVALVEGAEEGGVGTITPLKAELVEIAVVEALPEPGTFDGPVEVAPVPVNGAELAVAVGEVELTDDDETPR